MRRFLAYILLFAAASTAHAKRVTIPPSPAARVVRYAVGIIVYESDTVLLNSRILTRGKDYTIDYSRGVFDFGSLSTGPNDTLQLVYTPGPDWLKIRYGRKPPPIAPGASTSQPTELTPTAPIPANRAGNISISGAKSFRFSTRNAANSNFSQSLDLSLSGELTPGLTMKGAVSDRGYDPAYGTANSRLNELNKISLELESRRFAAKVGDLTLESPGGLPQERGKRVSGAWLRLHDPAWHVEAAAARPKGLFETARFYGTDGVQGPYQIGGRATPVVPGSEQVWLDGRLLVRGTNEAYTMDYPAGTITFNVGYPIDSRSRIEIDYEPQATAYREELFAGSGGAALGDSSVTFEIGWLREGDDKAQPLTGELTDADKQILAAAGDSTLQAVRSGVQPDTSGHYVLVADSLADTVYQYVVPDTGDYSITFSYVGPGAGSYQNVGGGQYQFVGTANGDFLPIVILTAPRQTDYYVARGGMRNKVVGDVRAEIRHSRFDRNLFSPLDDNNNDGSLYLLSLDRPVIIDGRPGDLSIRSRRREITYQPRERLYEPDFNRDFYLPLDFAPQSDEWLHRADLSVSPLRQLTLYPQGALLSYRDNTESRVGGMRATVAPQANTRVNLGWRGVRTDLSDSSRSGTVNTYNAGVQIDLARAWQARTDFETDNRTNTFSGSSRGTRFERYEAGLDHHTERLSLERYAEDSLSSGWQMSLRRTRLEFRSSRRMGALNYTATLAHQWLEQQSGRDNNFLGRLNLQYSNTRRRWNSTVSYLLSKETRYSRGLTFLEVEPGQGSYSLEDGQYVPDPNGNYIRVEEILSDRAKVSRGEKTFYFSKDWRIAIVRFNSRIEEDLLDSGSRSALWALPFWSDPNQPYQYYNTRYDIELRLLPITNAHAVNVTANQGREIRTVGGSNRERRDRSGTLTLKQVVRQSHFEESINLFQSKRDAYYTGGGNIDGWAVDALWRQQIGPHEISGGGGYRKASAETGEKSDQYLVRAGSRLAVISRGELRSTVELYRQTLTDATEIVSYTLTNNRPGERGAVWSVELRYGIKKSLRVNASISGRHADNRPAQITARGEMVAEF